jgi:hypothetical protein
LNDVNARGAVLAGCKIAIDTDTHTTIFDEIDWGIGVGRRAWLTSKDVINCFPLPDLLRFLRAKRDRAA